MGYYVIEEFEVDILDTEGIMNFIKDCNESWGEIASDYYRRNKGVGDVIKSSMQIESKEAHEEILKPYIKDFLELLEVYELDWWRLCSVEAVSQLGVQQLVWEFINDVGDVLYVFNLVGEWKTARVSPVVRNILETSDLSPKGIRWIAKA